MFLKPSKTFNCSYSFHMFDEKYINRTAVLEEFIFIEIQMYKNGRYRVY